MKKAVFALAAVLALSASAFAGETVKDKRPPVVRTHKVVNLDCGKTGSIAKPAQTADTREANRQPRLGIHIDPWIMPNTF